MASTINWEPLPPRKKSRKQTIEAPKKPTIEESIQSNIEARSRINRSQTTLESKDGCASEFYEC